MAQEIMVAGAIYEDVPSVRLPDSNGVFHPFTDTSDTTAVAADVAQGKTFHLADGTLATGTASGGSGGSSWTLIAHREYIIDTQPTTTQTYVDTINISYADAYRSDKILCSVARKRDFVKQASQYVGTDVFVVNIKQANGESPEALTIAQHVMLSYGTDENSKWRAIFSGGNTSGGLYIYSATPSGDNLAIEVYKRYNSYWGDMVGTYDFDVYMLDWPSGAIPFVAPTS